MNTLIAVPVIGSEAPGRMPAELRVGRLHDGSGPDATTEFLAERRETIVDEAERALRAAQPRHYGTLDPEVRRERLEALYEQVAVAAATHNLSGALAYARQLAQERFATGYDLSEVQVAINALEETMWKQIFAELPPEAIARTLAIVSTVLGALKDTLAREYVSLATHRHVPSLDLKSLFAGIG